MKLAARSICHVLFLIFCIPSLLFAADDPPKRPLLHPKGVSKDAPPINTVSEHVDPFSGILTLSHTDVHLPGNGGLERIGLVRVHGNADLGPQGCEQSRTRRPERTKPLGYRLVHAHGHRPQSLRHGKQQPIPAQQSGRRDARRIQTHLLQRQKRR